MNRFLTHKKCRHCTTRPAHKPRGLCGPCYYDPAVRESYGMYAKRGVGNRNREPASPDEPTAALPGSPEKVVILEERANAGRALWHHGDRTLSDEDRFVIPRRPRRQWLCQVLAVLDDRPASIGVILSRLAAPDDRPAVGGALHKLVGRGLAVRVMPGWYRRAG